MPPPTTEPPPAGPPEAPEQVASAPTPSDVTVDRAGTLRGHRAYKVVPGDCLWSIAAAVLPAGESNAEIEVEVARLWRINASRIGTGDPNLILVGTDLALR
jgi:Tfp pilus assembly protein FimV